MDFTKLEGKRLVVGTPAYSGWVHTEYTKSLLETQAFCAKFGIQIETVFLCQCARITKARNEIVRLFMSREADYLLMIDSDIGWQPHAPAQLMLHDLPYVAAVTVKRGTEKMCLRNINPRSSEYDYDAGRNLLRVGAVGTAFVMWKRELFEAMERAYPNLELSEEAGGNSPYAFFAEMITPVGGFEGEDYACSDRARAIGFDIWVDPWVELSHTGEKRYCGMLAQDMKLQAPVSADEAARLSEAAD